MADIDAELRRYRVDFHSIAVGFAEPGSAFKLRMTFEDDFGEELPFKKFGYMSFDAFLNDHPDLERVMIEGKPCYRAKLNERTADIQSLVSRQKKKKKNKGNGGKKRGVFQRNVQTRSFQYRPPPPQQNSFNVNQRSFRGGGRGAPLAFSRASFTSFPRQPPQCQQNAGFASRASVGMGRMDTPSQPRPLLVRPDFGDGPAAGKARILNALNKCAGKATLTKLNYCYQQLYSTQLDKKEMMKYFNTNNFRNIHKDWLSEDMDLNPGSNGQWVFLSKEVVKQQQDWAAAHKNLIVTEAPRQRWDKPTLKELFDKVVAMLVNMHPEPIHISQMAEVYKRAHGVLVDPNDLYCKTWEDLVKTTFRDKMILNENGSIVLSEKALREHGISSTKTRSAVATPVAIKRVTADDLGLEYSDDSESDEDDDDNTSFGSTSTFSSRLSAREPRKSSSQGYSSDGTSIMERLRVGTSKITPPVVLPAQGEMTRRTIFGEVIKVTPLSQKTQKELPSPEKTARKSIFDRLTFARKLPESPLSSVFTAPTDKKSLNTVSDLRKGLDESLAPKSYRVQKTVDRSSEQPPPPPKESSKGFSFMKTLVSRPGFGVKKTTEQPPSGTTSIFSRLQAPDRRTETPYKLWNSPSNTAAPNEHSCGESDDVANLVLPPSGFQVNLPESILARLQSNRITRKLPGMGAETPAAPKLVDELRGAPPGFSDA